jgi:hypothetical protein
MELLARLIGEGLRELEDARDSPTAAHEGFRLAGGRDAHGNTFIPLGVSSDDDE